MRAPMTLRGAQRLREELEELKSVKRPAVIEAIAEARAHGDLKENAEYHAAREQQSFIEGRIKQLEGELSHADVIDVDKAHQTIRVKGVDHTLTLKVQDPAQFALIAKGDQIKAVQTTAIAIGIAPQSP